MSSGASPPPPPPPSLPSGVEYKVVSWRPDDYEYTNGFGKFGGPTSNSISSFIDVARRVGLTDEDIFTTCSYPKQELSNGEESRYYAIPMSRAEMSFVDCVLGKLINFIAKDRWTLLQGSHRGGDAIGGDGLAHPYLNFYTLYFQRNA